MREKVTIKKWILDLSDGAPIEGVVLGAFEDWEMQEYYPYIPFPYPARKLLSWEEAIPFISYEFDNDFGREGCFPFFAWTKDKLISVSKYDGSTSPFFIPRNPCDCVPDMPGGG